MVSRFGAATLIAFSALATLFADTHDSQPPASQQKPVRETVHGLSIVDPYKWLENASDPVDPANSRKMTARLQAASTSGKPILLSINSGAGHGIGTALSMRVEQEAEIYAFLFQELGVKYRSQ